MIDAHVAAPDGVVVAALSIPKGTCLTADDLTIRYDRSPNPNQVVFQTIEEAVGLQTRRTIPAGTAALAGR